MPRRRIELPPAWRHRQLRRRWSEARRWLRRQKGSPAYRARGLAAGVFTGCLPFFGLQIVLGVALAGVLRGHPVLAAAGTWISNPLTTIPMCWLNLQLGILVLGPAEGLLDLSRFASGSFVDLGWDLSSRLLVGSLLMGGLAAPPCGLLCWWWLQRRHAQASSSPGKTIRSM